ncbi:cell death protein 3-like protein [Leptotrombidium deliense]|uniref:Cell death protein 3-like protein n=1 Tax=Leptotrombidium deliense TaxID=299467 RepID=A0A443SWM1_9ACAR|nr:cell death protein 3-like protein [Leptotrombidium deliense]
MTSKPRGYCVIINNRDFEEEDEIRKMSELDAKYLTNAFAYLGFDVRLHSNLTHTEMKDVLDDYSQRDDLKNHDAIVVIIMTHGNEKHLRAIDGGYLTEDEITSPFAADNCPALNRKPKMFFIQACRGEKDDEGVLRLPDSDDDDNSRFVHTTEVCDAQPFSVTNSTGRRRSSSLYDPSHGDMLISYATVSGYRAYRTVDADHPSYLVQYAHEKKLRDILDNVYRDVSEMETEDGYKQAPTYENRGFHKNLYFNPGYYE